MQKKHYLLLDRTLEVWRECFGDDVHCAATGHPLEAGSCSGEVLYESAPQLTLQLYILLSQLKPNGWAWFSITTSSLSLLFSLVYSQYIENRPNSTWRDYVKSIIVILPNMIFRILSLRYFLVETI